MLLVDRPRIGDRADSYSTLADVVAVARTLFTVFIGWKFVNYTLIGIFITVLNAALLVVAIDWFQMPIFWSGVVLSILAWLLRYLLYALFRVV